MASLPLQRHVLLHDLVSSAHLNGLVGFCEKLDEKSGRLAVRMPSAVASAKAPILLQPKNVSRLGDVVNDISSACEAEHAD